MITKNDLTATNVFTAVLSFYGRHWRASLAYGCIFVAISLLVSGLFSMTLHLLGPAVVGSSSSTWTALSYVFGLMDRLLTLLLVFSLLCFTVAALRGGKALLPKQPLPRFGKMLLVALGYCLLIMIILMLLVLLSKLGLLISIPLGVAQILLYIKLSMYVAALAAGDDLSLKQAWALSSGHLMVMFLTFLIPAIGGLLLFVLFLAFDINLLSEMSPRGVAGIAAVLLVNLYVVWFVPIMGYITAIWYERLRVYKGPLLPGEAIVRTEVAHGPAPTDEP